MIAVLLVVRILLTAYVTAASTCAEKESTSTIFLTTGIALEILIVYSLISVYTMPDTVTRVIRDYHSGEIRCTTHIEEGDTTYTYKYK